MKIILANPRGFCAGVRRAIDITTRAIKLFGSPIYVKHEIVHNSYVINSLKAQGVIFIEDIAEVPDNSIIIFSAHGVSKQIQQQAKKRDLNIFDATCPLVVKVHMEVAKYSKNTTDCILIGHKGHPEVEGTMGQYNNPNGKVIIIEKLEEIYYITSINTENLAYVTQTTLSITDTAHIIDKLREKFPKIIGPRKSDICYATENRQNAIRELAKTSDVLLVIGSKNSSNSNRLREIAADYTNSYLIDDENNINYGWFNNCTNIGISAGASAPELLVKKVINNLQQKFNIKNTTELEGIAENIQFSLPKQLQ